MNVVPDWWRREPVRFWGALVVFVNSDDDNWDGIEDSGPGEPPTVPGGLPEDDLVELAVTIKPDTLAGTAELSGQLLSSEHGGWLRASRIEHARWMVPDLGVAAHASLVVRLVNEFECETEPTAPGVIREHSRARALHALGADMEAVDEQGRSAADIAAATGNLPLATAIGASSPPADNAGQAPPKDVTPDAPPADS